MKSTIAFKKKLLLLLCGAVLPCFAAVVTPTVELQTSGEGLLLVNKLPGSDWTQAKLQMSVFDGKAKKFLAAKPQITDADGKITVVFSGKDFVYKTEFTARGELIYGKSFFTNNRKEEMWIEPALTAVIDFKRAPVAFWDGFGATRKIGGTKLTRNGIKGLALAHIGAKELPFPAAGVFGENSGLQLGYLIFDDVSYASTAYDPAKKEFTFTQRQVLHPGETLQINWVSGSVSARFGGPGAAVQQHYDAFPEKWAIDQDNPYVWYNQGHYLTWKYKADLETVRRLKIACDWAYTPYKRAGDILCRPELWDYKLRNKPTIIRWLRFGGKRVPMYEISREDFLKMRREEYRKYGKRFGWMFYANCAGTWCELDLAKERYPDAISNLDPHANHLLKKWSTWHDWEIRVFPMGTSFAKAFQEDAAKLTEELDLPGFAFDCATGGVSYYGPAVKKQLPGRAWDEKGVFIDQSVGVNHMVDYLCGLRKNMVVFSNGQLKGNLIMFERDFVRTEEVNRMMPLYRWYIGSRPSLVHGGGYRFNEMVANWRNLNKAEFVDVMTKLGVYEMFNQFKYGMGLTFVVQYGVPELVYIFPELFELRRAGWRAVVPVLTGKSLYAPYRGAYGGGANSFLFFGNSGTEKSTGSVRVDNDQLTGHSGEVLVFVKKMRRSGALANRIRGKYTDFRAILPSRVPVLYETVCSISGAPEKMDLQAFSRKDLDKQIYTAAIRKSPEFTGKLKIRAIRGFDGVVKVNGSVVAQNTPVQLKTGDVITAEYTSRFWQAKRNDIRQFPFTNGSKKVTCKVWYDANDKAAAAAAKRFDLFFRFLQKRKILGGGKVEFIHDPAQRGAAGVVTLDAGAAESQAVITPAGGLLISAPGAEALEKAVEKVLDELDGRYPYHFPFKACAGMPKAVLDYFKMSGKTLPLRKFFD